MKKTIKQLVCVLVSAACILAMAGTALAQEDADAVKGGKILYLSQLNSGPQYDAILAYLDMLLGNLGYTYEVVYGDQSNDPAANLQAVKNAMTNDVVGLITTQDGGLGEIMKEFPDMYVAGFGTELASVFDEGGTSASCLESDHFLGTVADQCLHGEDQGRIYFDYVVEKGFKKVATICFPGFAYPQLIVADQTFRALVDEYNQTAEEPMEVVGETEILMFSPLSDAYFMESDHQDLDAIVSTTAGCTFIYPAMKNAIDAGIISADTKLVTSGFENDEYLLAEVGDGIIAGLVFGNIEGLMFPAIMIDNAVQGKLPADYEGPEAIDNAVGVIPDQETIQHVVNETILGTADAADVTTSWETLQQFLTRYNPDASYKEFTEYVSSVDFVH